MLFVEMLTLREYRCYADMTLVFKVIYILNRHQGLLYDDSESLRNNFPHSNTAVTGLCLYVGVSYSLFEVGVLALDHQTGGQKTCLTRQRF